MIRLDEEAKVALADKPIRFLATVGVVSISLLMLCGGLFIA